MPSRLLRPVYASAASSCPSLVNAKGKIANGNTKGNDFKALQSRPPLQLEQLKPL